MVDKTYTDSDHDFVEQSNTYHSHYGDLDRIPGPTLDNSMAVVFLGVNDVGGMFLRKDADRTRGILPKIVARYMNLIENRKNLNKIAVIGVPRECHKI